MRVNAKSNSVVSQCAKCCQGTLDSLFIKACMALVLTLQAVHSISGRSKSGLHNLLHFWVSRDSLKLTGVGRPSTPESS